jgi:hypothetical protein
MCNFHQDRHFRFSVLREAVWLYQWPPNVISNEHYCGLGFKINNNLSLPRPIVRVSFITRTHKLNRLIMIEFTVNTTDYSLQFVVLVVGSRQSITSTRLTR